LLSVLDEADAYVARNGLELPEEPQARRTVRDADCVKNPILSLDLAGAGIATIIWATGFTTDYSWLNVDTFDEKGRPRHQRGVSAEPGIYFLGAALAITARIEFHLGRLARCQVSRGPDHHPAQLYGLSRSRIPPTMTRCLPGNDASCPLCGKPWNAGACRRAASCL
jgi:hypothetical protein